MIKLTDLMRALLNKALADGVPCLVGTATRDGKPQISPKGSVAVYDDETLCFWERSMRTAHAHIGENPHVVVYYRNFARARRCRTEAAPFASTVARASPNRAPSASESGPLQYPPSKNVIRKRKASAY